MWCVPTILYALQERRWSVTLCNDVTATTLWPLVGSPCPIDSYCLNGGTCTYYETVAELVCQWVDYTIKYYKRNIYNILYTITYMYVINYNYSVLLKRCVINLFNFIWVKTIFVYMKYSNVMAWKYYIILVKLYINYLNITFN